MGSRGGEGGAATTSAAEAVRACGKSAGRNGWDAQQRRGGEGAGATSSAATARWGGRRSDAVRSGGGGTGSPAAVRAEGELSGEARLGRAAAARW